MRYAHTNIIAKDWKKLVDFYTGVFECVLKPPVRNQSGDWLAKGTGVPNAALQGAHLLLPGHGEAGPTLEIYQYSDFHDQEALMPNHRGFGHLAFEVDSVHQTLRKMVENGGQSFGDIIEKEVPEVGIITFTYARDPEGNLIELQSWT